ncbi:hypothetical protein AB0C64_43710, partial [Streptomyces sp900116325]
ACGPWSTPATSAASSRADCLGEGRSPRMYLEAAGIAVKPTRDDAIALKDLLLDSACTAARIAALLRTWPTTT